MFASIISFFASVDVPAFAVAVVIGSLFMLSSPLWVENYYLASMRFFMAIALKVGIASKKRVIMVGMAVGLIVMVAALAPYAVLWYFTNTATMLAVSIAMYIITLSTGSWLMPASTPAKVVAMMDNFDKNMKSA